MNTCCDHLLHATTFKWVVPHLAGPMADQFVVECQSRVQSRRRDPSMLIVSKLFYSPKTQRQDTSSFLIFNIIFISIIFFKDDNLGMEGDRRMSVVELERKSSFGQISPGSAPETQPPLFTPSNTTLQPPKISIDNTNDEEIHGKLSIPDDGNFLLFLLRAHSRTQLITFCTHWT